MIQALSEVWYLSTAEHRLLSAVALFFSTRHLDKGEQLVNFDKQADAMLLVERLMKQSCNTTLTLASPLKHTYTSKHACKCMHTRMCNAQVARGTLEESKESGKSDIELQRVVGPGQSWGSELLIGNTELTTGCKLEAQQQAVVAQLHLQAQLCT